MNFFTYDAGTVKTSHSIWIFFIISLVVTAIGLGMFIWLYGWTKLKNMLKSLVSNRQNGVPPTGNQNEKTNGGTI